VWDKTGVLLSDELAGFQWADVFTGQASGPPADRTLSVGRLLADFPVALLHGRR
jgi:hypothetical protein